MADEVFDRPNMVAQALGKRECRAHQARHSLAQRTVEPLDDIRVARAFGADPMLCGRDDALVGFPIVGGESGVPAIQLWNLLPQLACAFAAAVADMKSDDLLGLSVDGNPDPWLVGFTADETPQFISFGLQAQQSDPTAQPFGWLHIKVIRQCVIEFGDEGEQPAEADIHDAADAAQREAFKQ